MDIKFFPAKKDKFLFLDVDGVLNNDEDRHNFGIDFICSKKVGLLAEIVFNTDAKLILSSDWRRRESDRLMVEEALNLCGLKLSGITPIFYRRPRWMEIADFLQDNPNFERAVILDDDEGAYHDTFSEQSIGFFHHDYNIGLTQDIASRVIDYLNQVNL